MRRGYEVVRQHLEQAAVTRKDYYDRKVKEASFKDGDWVWYLYPRRRVGKSPKWQRFYTGPYMVTRVLPPNDVVLQKSKRAKLFVVHRDKVKRYYGTPPVSWLKTATGGEQASPAAAEGTADVQQSTGDVEQTEPAAESVVDEKRDEPTCEPTCEPTSLTPCANQNLSLQDVAADEPIRESSVINDESVVDVADPASEDDELSRQPDVPNELSSQQIQSPSGPVSNLPEDDPVVDTSRPKRNRRRPSYLKQYVSRCREMGATKKS